MDPVVFSLLVFSSIFLMIALGVPVALSIFVVTAVGAYLAIGETFLLSQIKTIIFTSSSNYTFAVVPMFVLMGEIAGVSRIITDLYEACYRWMGTLRGGVYNATIMASAGFAAISGSTVVNAAVFTRVALPEIERLGLNRGFGAGCIAAAGTLAAMIPPSLTMVLYGILTEESIGAMLIAGILPGILTALMLMVTVYVMTHFRKDLMPASVERFSFTEKVAGFKQIWPAMLLALIITGGIYSGTVSPSAAGTIGVAGAVLIGVLRRRLSVSQFASALKRSVVITASLFIIIISGLLLSRILVMSGSVAALAELITETGLAPWAFLGTVILAYFLLGMFVDPVSLMVITIPFLYPAASALDIDTIWFGIIIVKLVEIAAITPPIGINLFAVISSSDGRVTAREIYGGVIPFVFSELLVLAILLMVPALSTYLPETMFR